MRRIKLQMAKDTDAKSKLVLHMFFRLIYLSILLITNTLSFSQGNYWDVVYLKNGSVIRGVIIEQIPNKNIKIETADKNIFVFQIDEIEKLVKEPYLIEES